MMDNPMQQPTRDQSLFRTMSIGTAAENLPLDSEFLEIAPQEQLPMLNGELTQAPTEYEARSSDANNVAYEEKQMTTSTLRARWKGLYQPNRMTPPNIRRGEQVLIFQYADADEYFWDAMGNSQNRRMETVVFAFSATPDEDAGEMTPENSYTVEISAHHKQLAIKTSAANGERTTYEVAIDAGDGNVKVVDGEDNGFVLDTPNKQLKLYNGDGSFVEVVGKTINIEAETVNVKGTKINTTGEKTQTGNQTHVGNMAIQGGITGTIGKDGSGATFQGGIRCTQDGVFGGISVMHHIHNGDSGGKTSPPIG